MLAPGGGQPITSFRDYTDLHPIGEGRHAVVFRARGPEGQPVVLKLARDARPSESALRRFQHEHDLGSSLDLPHVLRVFRLEFDGQRPGLVLEDIGGRSLAARLGEARPSPRQTLDWAIQLCSALDELHREDVIHKDVKPSNVVVSDDGRTLRLADLGAASRVSRERGSLTSATAGGGTLAYIAPEQTGRMNRTVDSRADLYSLGVTLFELLTGQLPFDRPDPMSMVHAHLAVPPAIADALDPSVPAPLAAITDRLLNKNPEDRYQTARGVRTDLEACREVLASGSPLVDGAVSLGADDVPHRFALPERLYGREGERKRLLRAYQQAASGASDLVLVTGYSGIGKSALVRELAVPIAEARGAFVQGKYDQLRRAVPLSAIAEACSELVRGLLAESEDRIAEVREELTAALGPNGQLLIDLVPRVALILGPQPPAPEVGGAEARVRFQGVLMAFLNVFSTRDHPLVLFLDDLQWADPGSLEFIERLLTDSTVGYLLVVAAYRDNEVNAAHPLTVTLDVLDRAGRKPERIELGPLPRDAVSALLCEGLTKALGEPLVISDAVRQRLAEPDRWSLRSLGEERVKGKAEPIALFAVERGERA